MPYWRAQAEFILAWSSAGVRPTRNTVFDMRKALDESGVGAEGPFLLALLADVYGRDGQPAAGLGVLDEALAAIKVSDEFWWVAEIYRLKGEMLLSLNSDNAAAEAYFKKAIAIAQRQSAKWLELRATTHLARLWHTQEKFQEARTLLGTVYGWFTEGFEMLDLRDAKSMLDELENSP